MKNVPAIVLYLLAAAGGAYQIFAFLSVRRFFRSRRQQPASAPSLTPVSILKPLKGVDPGFKENLRTFCRQDYPEYEVVLGFSDPDDSAIKRVREGIVPFIDSSVRVVVSGKEFGANKKVDNMQGLVEAARNPLLAISDSDMRVEPQYLRTIVSEYGTEKSVGMVTCLYKISNPRSLGTALESLTIALDFLPSVLVARRLEGVTFGLGASMLVSKKALDDIGGLPAVADYLADDYQIGNRLTKKGYRVVLSRVVLENVTGAMSLGDYLKHQVRWARTYRVSRPGGFAGYGITHVVPLALLLLVLKGPSAPALSVLAGALAVRFGLAALVSRKVIRSRQWLKWIPLIPLKDLVSFGIWAWSFLGRTVSWRGRRYTILKEGRIVEQVPRSVRPAG